MCKKESLLSRYSESKSFLWFKRILLLLLSLELLYLILFNIFLNTSWVNSRISRIVPERFTVSWDAAWTLYPFRFHIENLKIEERGRAKKRQIAAAALYGTLSPLSLLHHSVRLSRLDIEDAEYAERSGSSTRQKSTHSVPKVSEEAGRALPHTGKPKERERWSLQLRGLSLSGHHSFKSDRADVVFDGVIRSDLRLDSKEHSFAVGRGMVDLTVASLRSKRGLEILQNAKITSAFKITPLDYSRKRGERLLKHLALDSAVSAQIKELGLIEAFLKRGGKVGFGGRGQLESSIHFKEGRLLPATQIVVKADHLLLKKSSYILGGSGEIALTVSQKSPDLLKGSILFGEYGLYRYDKRWQRKKIRPLFHGKGLALQAESSAVLTSGDPERAPLKNIQFHLPSVSVDDMALLWQFLPKRWSLQPVEGKGTLEGSVTIGEETLNAEMKFDAKKMKIETGDGNLQGDLGLLLKLKILSEPSLHADISGSSIVLTHTKLTTGSASKRRVSEPWSSTLRVKKGEVALTLPGECSTTIPAMLKSSPLHRLLSAANGSVVLEGEISRLDWVDQLLKSSLRLSLSGNGSVGGKFLIRNGKIAPESILKVDSETLEVGLLDYLFDGAGSLYLEKGNDAAEPLHYGMRYRKATLRRKSEENPLIEDIVMRLERTSEGSVSEGWGLEKLMHLRILSANVKSLTLYNRYLPEDISLRFVGGSADLRSDITLNGRQVKGSIKLSSESMKMQLGDRNISARLQIDTTIGSGDPRKMYFDISGSRILLDRAGPADGRGQHDDADWAMEADLKKAEIIWKKPLWLRSEVRLNLKDSRPIVAMIESGNSKFSFVSQALFVNDLKGEAKIDMEDGTMKIPEAEIRSDQVDIAAKAVIGKGKHNGVLIVKHKNFKALMKVEGKKKSFDIFNAQKSFDAYKLP